MRNLIKRRWI